MSGADEDSDSESDDDTDLSDSEEESDSEVGQMDLDVCPPGCDQSLYDNTCVQREKRLDIEETLVEEKKNRDALIKEIDGLQRKAKVVEASSRSAEQELEAFQVGVCNNVYGFTRLKYVNKSGGEEGRPVYV